MGTSNERIYEARVEPRTWHGEESKARCFRAQARLAASALHGVRLGKFRQCHFTSIKILAKLRLA
jgi:hypothetical protein